MENSTDICIYGDSLMKGTIPAEASRYRFTIGEYLTRIMDLFSFKVLNRAKFGAPVTKGAALLQQDLDRNIIGRYTLLEYGGNDCNFDWAAVSAAPEEDHQPKTPLNLFLSTLESMADSLLRVGSQPVLMTLPPIDAEKYLDCICTNVNCIREHILHWLGDAGMIYRYHEMYSGAIANLAARKGLPLVDVRTRFLDKHNYRDLISRDGIHPSEQGYNIIYSAFRERLGNLA